MEARHKSALGWQELRLPPEGLELGVPTLPVQEVFPSD